MNHETSPYPLRRHAMVCLIVSAVCLSTDLVQAQNNVGGHFGIVLPLVSRADGTTTTIADDFVIGFPMGITVHTGSRVSFDLELVPVIQNEPRDVALTVHPGVLVGVADRVTIGARMAFDVNRPSWGFTPLVNYRLTRMKRSVLFGELVVPVRFQQVDGKSVTSIGLAAHLGIGF